MYSWGSWLAHFHWIGSWREKAQELLLAALLEPWGESMLEKRVNTEQAELRNRNQVLFISCDPWIRPSLKLNSSLYSILLHQPTSQFLVLASLVRFSVIHVKNHLLGTEMLWRLQIIKAKEWMYRQWEVADIFPVQCFRPLPSALYYLGFVLLMVVTDNVERWQMRECGSRFMKRVLSPALESSLVLYVLITEGEVIMRMKWFVTNFACHSRPVCMHSWVLGRAEWLSETLKDLF